jgi:hypothetical protein
MFCGLRISIHHLKKNQLDAQLILSISRQIPLHVSGVSSGGTQFGYNN